MGVDNALSYRHPQAGTLGLSRKERLEHAQFLFRIQPGTIVSIVYLDGTVPAVCCVRTTDVNFDRIRARGK